MRASVVAAGLLGLAQAASSELVNGIYYDQYHTENLPDQNITQGINHVYIAFTSPDVLSTSPPGNFSPFVSVASMRQKFGPKSKVLISVGGWGAVFTDTAANETSRCLFAKNVGRMLNETGADGVDIDWEYPAGNGADYLTKPNSGKTSEIQTFPLLLKAVRDVIGSSKLLTIAVPGKKVDMIAFTPETVPTIAATVDYFNLMTYDLMNRRDTVTKHHTSVAGSLETVDTYLAMGLPASKAILGFAYYAKWFTTKPASDCATKPLGCATVPMEDAQGNDIGLSGAITFEPVNMVAAPIPTNLTTSPDGSCGASTGFKCGEGACCGQYGFCGTTPAHCGTGCQSAFGTCSAESKPISTEFRNALANGAVDVVNGGAYYWANDIFWSWDTPELIQKKFDDIVGARGLAGVMAWSLGEDTYDHKLMLAVQAGVNRLNGASSNGTTSNSTSVPVPNAAIKRRQNPRSVRRSSQLF